MPPKSVIFMIVLMYMRATNFVHAFNLAEKILILYSFILNVSEFDCYKILFLYTVITMLH